MSAEHDRSPDEQRAAARAGWEQVAGGWRKLQDRMNAVGMPVSRWLIDAIEPQPGHRVLELAAGVGETGFLAAELIQPGGTLICSDGAEAMLEQARTRAAELDVKNVEFKQLELEWIDLDAAGVDGVLCRWGYMFALDRDAALRETRRILRPGGRLAFATWAALEHNPWAAIRQQALAAEGHPPPTPPTPFDLGSEELLRTLLQDAGFTEIVTDNVEVAFLNDDAEDYWQSTLSISRHFAQLVEGLDESAVAALRGRIEAGVAPFATSDGSLRFPGRALVAAASA
ncbi:MAG TPA: methyltransferase domain-containing protein [Conexibacter sp.]|nr:methyltransferase domain-containing protein [Conexibacter sp.]